jgi:hypothetical protein
MDSNQDTYCNTREAAIQPDSMAAGTLQSDLLREVPRLFDTQTISEMDEPTINSLVAKSEEARSERARWSEKHGILREGSSKLKRFNKHRAVFRGMALLFPQIMSSIV